MGKLSTDDKIKIFIAIRDNDDIQSFSDITKYIKNNFGSDYKTYWDTRNVNVLLKYRKNKDVPEEILQAAKEKVESWKGTYIKTVNGQRIKSTSNYLLTGLMKCGYDKDINGKDVSLRYKKHKRHGNGYMMYKLSCRMNDEGENRNRYPAVRAKTRIKKAPRCNFSVNDVTGKYDKLLASKIEKEILESIIKNFSKKFTSKELGLMKEYIRYIDNGDIYKIISENDPYGFIRELREALTREIDKVYIYNDKPSIIVWKNNFAEK